MTDEERIIHIRKLWAEIEENVKPLDRAGWQIHLNNDRLWHKIHPYGSGEIKIKCERTSYKKEEL